MFLTICPRYLQTSSLSGHYREKTGDGLVKIAQGKNNDAVVAWRGLRVTITSQKGTASCRAREGSRFEVRGFQNLELWIALQPVAPADFFNTLLVWFSGEGSGDV